MSRRRTLLAAAGVAAAALVVGVCVTVAYGLSTGWERAAREADLPDVLVRFEPQERARVDARLRALPGLEARSYRFEATDVGLRAGGRATRRGALHVLAPGRRGFAVVEGRAPRGGAGEVLVEQGLGREWDLGPGDALRVAGLGPLRVSGLARSPDNVAFPVASAARVYVTEALVARRFAVDGPLATNLAQLWLRPGASSDVVLTQARAQSYGVGGVRFLTRDGVQTLIAGAAGVVVALLVAFSLVALGAAGVMLGAAAHADVQRRLPTLAVQRAIGFPRAWIVRAAARRAALVALPAAAVGLGAGALLAAGPAGTLLATLNEAPPGAALLGPLAGCLAAIVAVVVGCAAWPAWRATAAAPARLLRGGELAPRRGRSGGLGRLRLGASPAALGARLVLARRARFAGVVAVLGACAAVVLLMLGVASLLERLRDDPSTLGRRYQLTVGAGPGDVARIARVPGVEAASVRYVLPAADSYRLGEQLRVVALPGDLSRFEDPPLETGREVRADDEAVVGLGLAEALGLAPGGALALQLPDGAEARFRVVGVARALDNEGRLAYVRPARLGDAVEQGTGSVAVRVEQGADRDEVGRSLSALGYSAARAGAASPRSGTLLEVLGDLLRVVAGAVGLVLLYALVQALALTAAERAPTLALLRTLGAPPRTLALVLAGAGAMLALPAAALAVVLERVALAPLVEGLAAGYAELPLGASSGQVALVVAGLLAFAALAAGWVARGVRHAPIVRALRAP